MERETHENPSKGMTRFPSNRGVRRDWEMTRVSREPTEEKFILLDAYMVEVKRRCSGLHQGERGKFSLLTWGSSKKKGVW